MEEKDGKRTVAINKPDRAVHVDLMLQFDAETSVREVRKWTWIV